MSIEYSLADDGTMDTVVEVHCTDCGRTWTERFWDTAAYRDLVTGEMVDLTGLMEDYGIDCDCGD